MKAGEMVYFLYDILLFLASLIYLPFYAFRGRVGRHILMRLGFFSPDYFAAVQGKPVIWIHAVSVGEARASESLIRLIRARWPGVCIVASSVTPTGYAILKKILENDEIAFFAPLDISFVVRKFLNALKPKALVILETEIWPNLIRLAKDRDAVVIVANGRISDRSYKNYKKLKYLLSDALQSVDYFCMQTEESKNKIVNLGVDQSRVCVVGNIKFDISCALKEPPFWGRLKDALAGSFVFVAGSTHENEEEMLFHIYKSLRKDFQSLRLIIAPRHLERLDKIKRAARIAGLEALYASRLTHVSSSQVILLDTIGDLNILYSLADIVLVGGSLVDKGGHNPIEPALFGKPIIFGKFMRNFKEIRTIFLKNKAAQEVDTIAQLEYQLRRLLIDPAERKSLGDAARHLIVSNKGAADRCFSVLERLMPL